MSAPRDETAKKDYPYPQSPLGQVRDQAQSGGGWADATIEDKIEQLRAVCLGLAHGADSDADSALGLIADHGHDGQGRVVLPLEHVRAGLRSLRRFSALTDRLR